METTWSSPDRHWDYTDLGIGTVMCGSEWQWAGGHFSEVVW
jgi:hypothetical protein